MGHSFPEAHIAQVWGDGWYTALNVVYLGLIQGIRRDIEAGVLP